MGILREQLETNEPTGRRTIAVWRMLVAGSCVGWILWAWLGGIEGTIMALTFPGEGLPDAVVLLGVIAYGLNGALLGLLISALLIPFRRRAATTIAGVVALLFFLWFGGVLGGGITFRFMPRSMNPASLGVFLGFLTAGSALAWCLYRLIGTIRLPAGQLRVWLIALAIVPLIGGAVPLLKGYGDPKGMVRSGPGAGEQATESLPNILFILVDTLRSDHVGAYGYPLSTTPTIDNLAATGMLFENAVTSSSWTRPAVATIFSGLYPSTHGLTNYYSGFPADTLLMPEILQAKGYQTAVFSNNGHVSAIYGFGQGVDHINSTASNSYQFFFLGQLTIRVGNRLGFAPARVAVEIGRAVEHLLLPTVANDGSGADLNRYFFNWLAEEANEPFFAYLHYMEPHAPYRPSAPWDAMYDAEEIAGFPSMPPVDRDKYPPFDEATVLTPPQVSYMTRRYDAEVRYQDALIAEVLDRVDAKGLERNTLIIFTSDHGEEFGDHGHWGHGKTLFRELTHVPLILNFQDRLPAGVRMTGLVELVDILPTILGLVGITVPAPIFEGRDLAPSLTTGSDPPTEQLAMSELVQNGFSAVSLEDQEYLFISLEKRGDQRELLFNLRDDPQCTVDIAPREPDIVASFRARLDQKRSTLRGQAGQGETIRMGEETLEKLRALGYVE